MNKGMFNLPYYWSIQYLTRGNYITVLSIKVKKIKHSRSRVYGKQIYCRSQSFTVIWAMAFHKNPTSTKESRKITEFCGKKHENIPQHSTSMWAQGISNKLNVTCIIYLFLVRLQIQLKHMAVLLILHVTSEKHIKNIF